MQKTTLIQPVRKARIIVILLFSLFLFSCAGVYTPDTVRKEITSTFKALNVTEVKESEIPGVYEIYYTGVYPGIIYYYPPKKLLIFGEIWDVNGTSLTGLKLEKYLENRSLEEEKSQQKNPKNRE